MASGELGYENLQPHLQAGVVPGDSHPPSGPRRRDASRRRPPAAYVAVQRPLAMGQRPFAPQAAGRGSTPTAKTPNRG